MQILLQLQFWAGRNLNYTVKNNITTIRDMSCRSAACKKSYGPYPGLLSNETYCVIIARAPNATLPKSNRTGTNASDPDLLTVRYRVRTDCSGASAASMVGPTSASYDN